MTHTVYPSVLELVSSSGRRRPAQAMPSGLDALFRCLAASDDPDEADEVEQRIWSLWMYHPHHKAARHLDRAATEIASHCHDLAETRLTLLLRGAPEYSEASNKCATLYYLQQRDEECLEALRHVLSLEPRHFGAICAAAEIFLSRGNREEAVFAFETALRIHPHLGEARQRLLDLH
ncbi:MAG: hypothetical protein GC151_04990 [Betaproteobacteria bacterium]|nr:hypothetical protein [Betaproteobacteria bacterium]